MRNVDIVIPGLFLPQEICADVCAGLPVPFLEKMLARSTLEPLPGNGHSCDTLEKWLCQKFGMERQQDEPIAPVTLAADGMQPGDGYWLRADPVHLQIRRTQLLLLPDLVLGAEEAAQLCASLNLHFNADGLHFFAPSPQRWYLRVENAPKIVTTPLSQASGRGVQMHLPKGKDALRWHKIFNEIQMIFFEHEQGQMIIIFDDLVNLKNQKPIEEWYVRGRKVASGYGCSMLYLTQSWFKTPKLIRIQCNHIFIKRLTSNRDLNLIISEYGLTSMKAQIIKAYKQITSESKVPFLLVRTDSEPNERFSKNFLTFLHINDDI